MIQNSIITTNTKKPITATIFIPLSITKDWIRFFWYVNKNKKLNYFFYWLILSIFFRYVDNKVSSDDYAMDLLSLELSDHQGSSDIFEKVRVLLSWVPYSLRRDTPTFNLLQDISYHRISFNSPFLWSSNLPNLSVNNSRDVWTDMWEGE